MLNEICISNFKAFNDLQRIPLKPITLLYGTNSAGKSSVIQSLLMLKQSISETEAVNAALIPKGKLINLGNYKEMVFTHDENREIIIKCGFNRKIDKFSKSIFDNIDNFAYEAHFFCDETKHIKLRMLSIFCGDDNKPLLVFKKAKKRVINPLFLSSIGARNAKIEDKEAYQVELVDSKHPVFVESFKAYLEDISLNIARINNNLEFLENRLSTLQNYINIVKSEGSNSSKDVNSILADIKELNKEKDFILNINLESFHKKINEILSKQIFFVDGFIITSWTNPTNNGKFIRKEIAGRLPDFTDLIINASLNYRAILNSIIYLGPLREYPERHYIFSGVSPENVGKSGKYTADLLFINTDLVDKVNLWIKKFGIDYKMMINKVDDEEISDLYSMRLFDEKLGISISPTDVGFGISQLLPIIVQSILCKNNVICIEQPEIHIHPKLQTELGTFLKECTREGNQFLIETHSEHLLLRIQKLIRNKELSSNQVSVIYVDRQNDGSKCLNLRLDSNGDFIDNWPEGFFEEGYREVFF